MRVTALIFGFSLALVGCATRPPELIPPEALSPPASELLLRAMGVKEGADPIFHRSMHAGGQAFNRGDYATGERYYSVGLKRAQEIGMPDYWIAWAASYLFDAYVAQAKYGEADQLFRESLTIIEKNHPKKTDYLKKYAALLRRMGREAEAAAIEARTMP